MIDARRAGRAALALASAALAACASRGDLRVVQQDLIVMRAEAAQADSARRRQLDTLVAVVRRLDDSLVAANGRLGRFQGEVGQSLHGVTQQLITIQELTGQSQRRLQELRGELEQRARAQSAVPPASAVPATSPPGGETGAMAQAPTGPPGPNQLFQVALDQLRRGSAGTARAGLLELLRAHPQSDMAGEAQFYLGEAYAAEGNAAAADSAYVAAYTRFPGSGRAATAMYKHALHVERSGRAAESRAALEQIVRQFPRSDEAVLARERLAARRAVPGVTPAPQPTPASAPATPSPRTP